MAFASAGEGDLARGLLDLADACEAAGEAAQDRCIHSALPALAALTVAGDPARWQERVARAHAMLHAGAAESAVLALIPDGATWTGARLGHGQVVAQVVLEGEVGAHSRDARAPALAWLAALLRALARQVTAAAVATTMAPEAVTEIRA